MKQELNYEQLVAVLEDITTHADTLHRLLMAAQEAQDAWTKTAQIDAAVNCARFIGAMADDAIGGRVVGGFHAWAHGPNFASTGNAEAAQPKEAE